MDREPLPRALLELVEEEPAPRDVDDGGVDLDHVHAHVPVRGEREPRIREGAAAQHEHLACIALRHHGALDGTVVLEGQREAVLSQIGAGLHGAVDGQHAHRPARGILHIEDARMAEHRVEAEMRLHAGEHPHDGERSRPHERGRRGRSPCQQLPVVLPVLLHAASPLPYYTHTAKAGVARSPGGDNDENTAEHFDSLHVIKMRTAAVQ